MTNQLEALIAKIKKQIENFDTVILKEDEALSLIAALEQSQQQNQKDSEIKARLCNESNSLFDRLRGAEKLISELESKNLTTSNALLDAGKRIAELEAREFVVELPGKGGVESSTIKEIRDWSDGWAAYREEAIKAIRAAGGTVGGE